MSAAYWAVAQLEPSRERLALHCLAKVNGFEIYSPRIKPLRPRREDDTRPLFPGYCFFLVALGRWWDARWSAGIRRVVLDGAEPAKVPDEVIDAIRRREINGIISLPRGAKFQLGQQVKVVRRHSPFENLVGVYAGMSGVDREMILLRLLGQQVRVVLPSKDIAALG